MKAKKGFTLIELLVVIAIIALLMAIIMPALRIAKQQAQAIVCVANLRGLSTAWYSYVDENNGKLVPGNVPNNNPSRDYWVAAPQNDAGHFTTFTVNSPVEDLKKDEIRGIERGALFPYIDAPESYHCPGDRGMKGFEGGGHGGYRSYSITGLMNGEEWNKAELAKKYSQISLPSNKIMFLENTDKRGWNIGSWIMGYEMPEWIDPLAIWHNERSTLGFADGHAEKHDWVDETTIEMAEKQQYIYAKPDTEDLTFMQHAYIPGRFKL